MAFDTYASNIAVSKYLTDSRCSQIFMFFKLAIAILIAGILSGCGLRTHYPSKVPDKLEDVRTQVTLGRTTREEVQEHFGEAVISTDRVEVYRVLHGEEVTVDSFIFIPMIWDSEDVIIYAMFIYDDSNVVIDVDWDIYEMQRTNTANPWREATLESGEYTFKVYRSGLSEKRHELLFAPQEATHNSLIADPPVDMCSVLVFLEESSGAKRDFYVNNDHVGETPLLHRDGGPPIFSKVLVPGGQHEIRVEMAAFEPRLFTQTIFCEPGNIIYTYPRIKLVGSEPYGIWRTKYKHEGEIVITNKPLEPHTAWRRLLFFEGKWMGAD